MEGDKQDFDFDDRDQELIEALAGNFCDQESDFRGNDQNNNDYHDGKGDEDNDIIVIDTDWDEDSDVILSNELGEVSWKIEKDDSIVKSLKEEIYTTKAKLKQLEAKLEEAQSGRIKKEQQSISQKIRTEPRPEKDKILFKDKEQLDYFEATRPNLEAFVKNAAETTKISKKNEVFKLNEAGVEDKRKAYERETMNNAINAERSGGGENLFKKKGRLAHAPKKEPKMDRSGIDNINIEKRKINVDQKPKPKQQPNENDRPWRTEAYSGIRIINPCISSTQMDSRMEGRRFIKLNTISRYIVQNEISGDWVTMGVVVGKLPPKTAANGKTFSIWRLSDLVIGHENETTSFFLFGNVYKEHWKTNEGTVVALLNSSIMPQRDNDNVGEVAITIDNPKKLMIMGISKDFGICKGVTRKGNQCSYVVNKVYGEYCEYHVSREHKKMMAGRMELQSSSTGPDLKKGKRMQAVKKDIISGHVCYAGRTLTWSDKGDKKKKADKKKSILSTIAGVSSNGGCSGKIDNATAIAEGKSNFDENCDDLLSEDFKSRLKVPTLGSRNLLKFLKKDEENENQKLNSIKPEVKSAKELISEQKEQINRSIKPISLNLPATSTTGRPARKFNANFKPTIKEGLHDDDFIEFCDSDDVVSDTLSSNSSCVDPEVLKMKNASHFRESAHGSQAKLKAITLVRNNKIKINKDFRKSKNEKYSPRKVEKIKDRVIHDISNNVDAQPPKKKRKGILGEIFGELDLESEEGKKLIAMKSENNHLVRLAEAEREQAYFNVLEKKEMYEEKMKSVMELKVSAVCCKICKYMHEFQSDYCKDQGHGIVRVDAVKRFFICKTCKDRTTSFKKFPVQPCRKCGSNNFEKTSMFQEKKGPKIGGETLLVRGEEHSIFLSSLK